MKEGPLSYRPEDPGPCPYGHGPEYSEFKADGRRVCHPCRVCSVPRCDREWYAREMCVEHYWRFMYGRGRQYRANRRMSARTVLVGLGTAEGNR